MENRKEKVAVNNYVIFKLGGEYHEGRLKGVSIEGTTETYQILCFTTFTDVKVSSSEILSNVSQEVKRKLKSTAYGDVPNQTYFPPAIRNVLIVDKEWSIDNTYDLPYKLNVNIVLRQFKDFLVNFTAICDVDEANEVGKGFLQCFNSFFKRFLLYPNEREQISFMKGEPSEYCGPVHIARLIYFIQKNVKEFIEDTQVKSIVLDYTIYLLDFMTIRYNEYF
ncbi:hypothetical protein GINT2_002019 [Glugoides intestinalis]